MTGKAGKDVYIRVPCGVIVSKKPIDDPYAVHYPRSGVDEDIWGDDEEGEDLIPQSEDEILDEQIASLSGEVDDEVIQVLKKHNNNPFNKFIVGRSGSSGTETGSGGSGGGIMWEKVPGEDEYEGLETDMDMESEEAAFELTYDKQTILVARGGDAGLGNYTAKGSKNRKPTLVSVYRCYLHGMNNFSCFISIYLCIARASS